MNIKRRIMAYLTDPPCDHGQGESCEVCDNVRRIMTGMSMGTATLVIDSAVRQKVTEDYRLEALGNRGRYYTATIVNRDGSIFQPVASMQAVDNPDLLSIAGQIRDKLQDVVTRAAGAI